MLEKIFPYAVIFILFFGVCCSTKKEQVSESVIQQETVEKQFSDTFHVSLPSIFLISNGGRIDADCKKEFKIIIESQNNQNFNSYSRLIYQFSSKEEYMDALTYINRKGSRWILRHQFEKEYSWNSPHQVSFEELNDTPIIVNNMYLNHIKK